MQRGDRPIVVCVGFDWRHPSPLRHLEATLARDHQLIHVESIGLRAPRPSLADLKRASWKMGRALGWVDVGGGPSTPGVQIIAPWVLPAHGAPTARWINAELTARAIRRAIPRGATPDLFLTALPTAADLVGRVGARTSVYYRVDDWPRWHGIDGVLVARLEGTLMDRVDLTFCTSTALLSTARGRRAPPIHLPQGVDVRHFGAALDEGAVHPAVAGLPGPVLGFFGLLDDRLDAGLLSYLSRRWPGTVVLVGERRRDAPALPRSGVVRHVGPVDYAALPRIARGVDAWLLPYVVGERTRAIDPLKLREYLATGAPVVSTPLPEVLAWSPLVAVGDTHSAVYEAALEAVADPGRGRQARLASLAGHSWDDRRDVFLDAVAGVERSRDLP